MSSSPRSQAVRRSRDRRTLNLSFTTVSKIKFILNLIFFIRIANLKSIKDSSLTILFSDIALSFEVLNKIRKKRKGSDEKNEKRYSSKGNKYVL